MSECGLLRTTKRTLCELILAACALLPTGCGAIPSERVPQHKVEQKTNLVLQEALEYVTNRQYAKAQGLLEQRRSYLANEQRKQFELLQRQNSAAILPESTLSPSEQTILAITYANTRNYSWAESEFRTLMNTFKNHPIIIEEVQKELATYFTTKSFKDSEATLIWAATAYPQLNAVLGFLNMAKQEYKTARQHFEKAVPQFEEDTVEEYRDSFMRLTAYMCDKDDNTALEYAKILGAVYNAQPKESKTKKQRTLSSEEGYRRGLSRLLAFVCKKEENEYDKEKKNAYNEIILQTARMIQQTYSITPVSDNIRKN
jgi:hypothetical protein